MAEKDGMGVGRSNAGMDSGYNCGVGKTKENRVIIAFRDANISISMEPEEAMVLACMISKAADEIVSDKENKNDSAKSGGMGNSRNVPNSTEKDLRMPPS